MAMLHERIQDAMEEAGGERMRGFYWSVARCDADNAWFFHGGDGRLNAYSTVNGLSARMIAYMR